MKRRARSVIYPEDALDRLVRQAVDTGKLQNLIFDNPGRWHGRAASAVVGSLLRLEPSRRILASRQVRSMLLAGLIRGGGAGAVVKKWF